MATAAIVIVVLVGGLALLMLSNFGKNPSRKTTSQLEREQRLHNRVITTTDVTSSAYQRRSDARNKAEKEFRRRKTEQAESNLPKQAPMATSGIRDVVSAGYEEGWRRAKSEGKDDKKALETALVSGLLNRLVGVDGWFAIAPELVQAMMVEIMPFMFAGSPDECRKALIEYAVWREVPTEAHTELVQRSVTAMAEDLRTSGDADFLATLGSLPVAWTKLMSDENSAS